MPLELWYSYKRRLWLVVYWLTQSWICRELDCIANLTCVSMNPLISPFVVIVVDTHCCILEENRFLSPRHLGPRCIIIYFFLRKSITLLRNEILTKYFHFIYFCNIQPLIQMVSLFRNLRNVINVNIHFKCIRIKYMYTYIEACLVYIQV